jgi:hypothetical protein
VAEPVHRHRNRALAEQYEQLRRGVLGGHADGWRLGLGVMSGQGLAAWMRTAGAAGAPTAPPRTPTSTPAFRQPPPGSLTDQVVAVLAQMALAHT